MGGESPKPASTPSGAVFLSYASQDAEAAKRICDALRTAGIEVWFDQSELRGGDAWDRKIRDQIHYCRLFIPVVSAHTDERSEGYFRREWRLAVERTRDMADDQTFVVPVVIDSTYEETARVPDRFREVQWVRLPAGEPTAGFVERIHGLLYRAPPVNSAEAWSNTHSVGESTNDDVTARFKKSGWRRAAWLAAGLVFLGSSTYVVIQKFGLPGRAAPEIGEKSIAVLPFVDLSEKKDQEYFADGMAEEILDLLAKLPAIKVIGRTSSFAFKGRNLDLRQIGLSLGASFLVEGSVRRVGDQLRVTTQLIRATDGSHVWSETNNESLGDVLRIQERIATSIVRALQVSIGIDDLRPRALPRVPEAYDLYLRGRHAFDRFDAPGFVDALSYFHRALALDPGFAAAAEMLALTEESQAEWGFVKAEEGFPRARATAEQALRLEPRSALAHAALCSIHQIYDWDWSAADRECHAALTFEPHNSWALAVFDQIAVCQGRLEAAEAALADSLSVDPLNASTLVLLGSLRRRTGAWDSAKSAYRRALDISPSYSGAHYYLGLTLLSESKVEEALAEVAREAPGLQRDAGLAVVLHAAGRDHESDAAISRLEAGGWYYEAAVAFAYRDDRRRAFADLERAFELKDSSLAFIKTETLLDGLHNDPNYRALLRRMNLPE
jgi:adenylate cyclase